MATRSKEKAIARKANADRRPNAHAKYVRISSRKVKIVIDLIRGKSVDEAAAILTGKFFEYLAAGPGILAFGPTDGDLAKALEETKSGTICDWDQKQAISDAIDAAWANHLAQQQGATAGSAGSAGTAGTANSAGTPNTATAVHSRFSAAALKYSRKELTGKLSGLLNDIINKK